MGIACWQWVETFGLWVFGAMLFVWGSAIAFALNHTDKKKEKAGRAIRQGTE